MTEEDKIAGEQRAGLLGDHGEIVVAVRRRPRPQDGAPAPEIKFEDSVHQKRRRYQAYLADQFVAHDAAKGIDIELSARGQGSRQILVTNEAGSLSGECGISEDMVRVAVRVYDVSDGLFRAGANGCEQLPAFAWAASGVD